LILYALVHGYLDAVPVDDITRFETELFAYFDGTHADVLKQIKDTGDLPKDDSLEQAVKDFAAGFSTQKQTPAQEAAAVNGGKQGNTTQSQAK
jgi:F-type H+-transporting ATPase subunit alpha